MALLSKPSEPSVVQLVQSAAADTSELITQQIELTKAEMKQTARTAGSSFALLGVGLAVLGMAGIFLLVTLAYVLVELGLPVWAGFGIVTLVLLIVGAILTLVGKKRAETVKGPERAMAQLEATRSALRTR